MDDMNLIRSLLTDDVPATTGAQDAARRRLRAAIAESTVSGVDVGVTEVDPSPTGHACSRFAAAGRVVVPRQRRTWWAVGTSALGTGLVAAAAAVVVVVGGGGATPAEAPTAPAAAGSPAWSTSPLTARDFLLAAASRAEREPVTRGRYWRVRWLLRIDGAPSWQLVEFWHATRPGDTTWLGELTYRDHTATEPATFIRERRPTGFGAEGEFSLAEVRALPTEPAALRAVLYRKLGIDVNHLTSDGGDGYVFESVVGLLARSPATPAQRAAGYRLLATLPMVRVDGTATDALGRTGTLIRYTGTKSIQQVIIDGDRCEVLAITKRLDRPPSGRVILGTPDGQSVIKQFSAVQMLTSIREWTDQEPVPPTVP